MGELQKEYEGKIRFRVLGSSSPEGQQAAMDYDFGRAAHGMAGFDAKGEHIFSLPGHNFGRKEILAELKVLLP